jgi:hypothetical protein
VTTIIEMMLDSTSSRGGAVSGSVVWCLMGRAHHHSYQSDRRVEYLLIALGFSLGVRAATVGRPIWWMVPTWPSFAGIATDVAVFVITDRQKPIVSSDRRIVFMVDSLVRTALSFIAWEVIIRAGVGDPCILAARPVGVLIYPLTDIAIASCSVCCC